MLLCRICGESKPPGEFKHITNFTKYKKQAVVWCRDCQKVWMDMNREKDRIKKFRSMKQKFEVSFE